MVLMYQVLQQRVLTKFVSIYLLIFLHHDVYDIIHNKDNLPLEFILKKI